MNRELPTYRSQSVARPRIAARPIVGLLMAIGVLLSAGPARSQFIEEPIDPKLNSWRRVTETEKFKEAIKVLRDEEDVAGAEALFSEVFEKSLFPLFTLKANQSSWPKMKVDFKRQVLNAAKKQKPLDILNQITLKKMSEYANGNYHPMCRYNAMLFIGELLNQSLVTEKKIVPMPEALDELMKAAGNTQMLPVVRVAAMIGLKRHAELGVPEEKKKLLSNGMQKLIATPTPPPGLSKEGQDWLRRRAAEICVALGVSSPEIKKVMEENKPLEALPGIADFPGAALGPDAATGPGAKGAPAKTDSDLADPLGVPSK